LNISPTSGKNPLYVSQQLGPRFGQHDVARLQIPMHHTLPVGFIQSIGNLDCEL
jgi:hypothetical protein